MTIKQQLEQALETTGVEYGYLERDESIFPFLVYTIARYPYGKSDNKIDTWRFDIYLNLYIKEKLDATTKKIVDAISLDGFNIVAINPPMPFDGLDYLQITINCTKVGID